MLHSDNRDFMTMSCLLLYILGVLAVVQGKPNDCISSDVCCQSGGWCGDGVFDACDGEWDYTLKCYPTYKTCCINRQQTTTTTTGAPTTTQPPTSTPSTTCSGGCTEGTTVSTPSTVTPPAADCGVRPVVSDPHIVGGVEAAPHSWPWAVSLELDYFGWGGWEHHCGGTLISNRHVLTAAHCVAKSGADGPENFRIILGMHSQDRGRWTGSEIVMPIENAFVHEGYSTSIPGSPNDICIIKLDRDVDFSAEISPACLPSYREQNFTAMGSCYIAGFGLTQGTGKEDVLNEARINVITNDLCDYKWETGSGRVGLIKESHICVGNGVPGTCNGDSGGPLQCEVDGRFVVSGATSFGAAGCTAENAPDVYTRISHFLPWIQEKMAL